jgi:hypothetical protein
MRRVADNIKNELPGSKRIPSIPNLPIDRRVGGPKSRGGRSVLGSYVIEMSIYQEPTAEIKVAVRKCHEKRSN